MGQVQWLEALRDSVWLFVEAVQQEAKKQAQLLILREALIRVKELGIQAISCRDVQDKWKKLFNRNTTIHWEPFQAFSDILYLSKSLKNIQFFQKWLAG